MGRCVGVSVWWLERSISLPNHNFQGSDCVSWPLVYCSHSVMTHL
jgi:hypothetical protein